MYVLSYLVSAICFILALKDLSHPKTARRGNLIGIFGMALAIVTTLWMAGIDRDITILIGIAIGGAVGAYIARTIPMTALPELVAAFHSLVGLAAVFIALAALLAPESYGILINDKIPASNLIEMALGAVIGAITFTGSIVAFAKLKGLVKGSDRGPANAKLFAIIAAIATILCFILFINTSSIFWFILLILLGFGLGYLLIMPVGGADMPVIVSMLNSYSGWAAAGIGFTLNNSLLIITGALVGASGAILSYIMCKAMNRSLLNVMFGGIGASAATSDEAETRTPNIGNADDAAFLLSNAQSVIIVPGYGMAVAQSQHMVKEMAELLKKRDIEVRYAIHPVAGRMPGHMNVLLAEANVPYDDVFELDEINRDFTTTDVVYIIGANDVTNPAAKTDKSSPLYGMSILDVADARNVLFVKRSLSPGYAGVTNDLFYEDNTTMLFGDAKKMTEDIIKALEGM